MIQMKIERGFASCSYKLFVRIREGNKRFSPLPIKIDFKEVEPNVLLEPFFEIDETTAIEFFEALALALNEAGFGKRTFDNMEKEALKYHLEDLRKLVFKGEK